MRVAIEHCSSARARKSLGEVFDPRHNSLTMMRLMFAVLVVTIHAWTLGEFGNEPGVGASSYGGLSIVGFFSVSGYLITASGLNTPPGRFLWHRALRFYPAYWVTLVLVAALLAPLAFVFAGRPLSEFPAGESFTYIIKNITLFQGQTTIPGTLEGAPSHTLAWNGAIWTLFFEFVCYLGIALLVVLGLLRTRVIGAIAAVAVAFSVLSAVAPAVLPSFLMSYYPTHLLLTGSLFLGGSLVYLLRERIPGSWWFVALAGAVGVAATFTAGVPSLVAGLGFVILVVRVSASLPQPSYFTEVDLSYGFYLIAFPVGQVLSVAGVNRIGLPGYLLATVGIALAFGAGSWYVIESRALRYRRAVPFRRRSAAAS